MSEFEDFKARALANPETRAAYVTARMRDKMEARAAMLASWEDYWHTVGNETYLYARELIELSPDVRAHFASRVTWKDGEADLDWSAAAAAADEWPASSTQLRLLALVLSLVNPDETYDREWRTDDEGEYDVLVTKGTRKIDVRDLGNMGSWRDDIARILFRYITGEPPRR